MTGKLEPEAQEKALLQQRIAGGSKDPDDYSKLANRLECEGQPEEAVRLYRQALSLPMTNLQKARLSTGLGWVLHDSGDRAQGQVLAQSAISLLLDGPQIPEVLLDLGFSHCLLAYCVWFTDEKSGREAAELGLRWLGQLMTSAPDFEDVRGAYYEAARLHSLLGNAKEAIRLCQKCLELKLDDMERRSCLTVYSEALRVDRQFDEAEKVVKEALQYARTQDLPLLYYTLGLIQRSTSHLAEAEETFKKVLGALKGYPYLKGDVEFLSNVYWNLGELYYNSEKLAEALETFQVILDHHPEDDVDHRNSLLWLGYCHQAMGEHSEAVSYFKEVLMSPDASETEKASAQKHLAWNLGKLHYESGAHGQAAVAFEEFLTYLPQDDPDRTDALTWLGHSYLATETLEKARDCFDEVLTLSNATGADKASALIGLGDIYLEGEQHEEAAAAFKEALVYQPENDPNHWNTLLRLGHAYFGQDYQKARECYEQVLASPHAAQADRDSARKNLTRSLANLYFEAGHYEKAAARFEEVLSYYPDDDAHRRTALLWLGRCSEAIGDYEKARACYEEVLASSHASQDEKVSAQEALIRLPKKTLH